jgi:CMP-N-acetylneuraminic acid synthetase
MDLISRTSVLLMAREGSKRFKNKNVAEFNTGQETKTLLEWTIEQLLEVFPSDKIILSSDSPDYLDLGSKYKVTLHRRENKLVESGSLAENFRNVAKLVRTEFVFYSNGPCNPLIGPKRIKEFFGSISPQDLDNGVFAIEEVTGHSLFRDEWLNFEPGEGFLGSEENEKLFRVVWGLSCRSTKGLISQGSMFSLCKPTFVLPTWAAVDINHEEDLAIAEAFIDKYFEYEGN